ncbi:MAG: transglutaminase domain-containing protein [Verrucomicrobiota bacterium]
MGSCCVISPQGEKLSGSGGISLGVSLLFLFLCSNVQARIWVDSTGKIRVIADLVKVEDNAAFLRERDGQVFRVPLSRLSENDQEYLRSLNLIKDDSPSTAPNPKEASKTTPVEYALVREPSRKIRGTMTMQVSAPRLKADEWVLFCPFAPTTPGQRVSSVSMKGGSTVRDLNSNVRDLLCSKHSVRSKPEETSFQTSMVIEAQLYSRRLVPKSETPSTMPKPLAPIERSSFLSETSLINYRSPEFGDWLQTCQLIRATGETEIAYAKRVFSHIKNHFEYSYDEKMNRLASFVCRDGASDCGGLAIVFVSAMRAHRIPSRLNAGLWAESSEEGATFDGVDYFQQHVKGEFYAERVGWVPVDLSSAILYDESEEGLHYFGNDPGDFVTLHFDHGIGVDTIHFGKQTVDWMQGMSYWVTGSGSLDGSTMEKSWVIDVY